MLICCYNAASNDPYKKHHHLRYTRLVPKPDEAVSASTIGRSCGDRAIYDPAEGKTVSARRKGPPTPQCDCGHSGACGIQVILSVDKLASQLYRIGGS